MVAQSWEYGWQWRAACRGHDSNLFFSPGSFETREQREGRERKAKSICAICPVQVECLDYALRIREPYGIWGGLNQYERRALLRQMDRRAQQHRGPTLRPVD